MAYLLLALSWALFFALLTAQSASKLKRILKAKWTIGFNWYGLFYPVLSLALVAAIMIQAILLPVQRVILPSSFGQYAGYLITTAGVIILMRSTKQISLFSFLGNTPRKEALTEKEPIVAGMYSQIRHPFFFGLVLIFFGFFLVSGTLGAVIHLGCLIAYLPFGIHFEEKNLLEEFGDSYRSYQKDVPAFFPRLHKKRG